MDDLEKLAKSVEEKADRWEATHKQVWGPKGKKPDPSMVVQGKEDATDLRYIAGLIRKGDKTSACAHADRLDTIVRDEIPAVAWRWLHNIENPAPNPRHVCPKCGHRF